MRRVQPPLHVPFVAVDVPQHCEDEIVRLAEPDIEFLTPEENHFRARQHFAVRKGTRTYAETEAQRKSPATKERLMPHEWLRALHFGRMRLEPRRDHQQLVNLVLRYRPRRRERYF